jgi:hypothetical protein
VRDGGRVGLALDKERNLFLYIDGTQVCHVAPAVVDPCYFALDLRACWKKVILKRKSFSFCSFRNVKVNRLILGCQRKGGREERRNGGKKEGRKEEWKGGRKEGRKEGTNKNKNA